MRDELSQLKDIKPPVEVPDSSFWFFLALIITIFLLLLALVYWFKYKRGSKRRKRFDPILEAKEKLKRIDFTDSKMAVYTFDEYLPVLIGDDQEMLKSFENLQKDLEKYKYKKDVPKLSEQDRLNMKKLIDRFIK
jgi:hypothetical protein